MLTSYSPIKRTHTVNMAKHTSLITPPPSPSGIDDKDAYSPDNKALSSLEAGTITPLKLNRSITDDTASFTLDGDYQEYPLADEVDASEDYYTHVFLKATCIALFLLYIGTVMYEFSLDDDSKNQFTTFFEAADTAGTLLEFSAYSFITLRLSWKQNNQIGLSYHEEQVKQLPQLANGQRNEAKSCLAYFAILLNETAKEQLSLMLGVDKELFDDSIVNMATNHYQLNGKELGGLYTYPGSFQYHYAFFITANAIATFLLSYNFYEVIFSESTNTLLSYAQIALLSLTVLSACFATICPELPLSFEALTVWLSQAYVVMKLENMLEEQINKLLQAKTDNNPTAMSTYKQGFFYSININVTEKTEALKEEATDMIKDINALIKTPNLSKVSKYRLNEVIKYGEQLAANSEPQQPLQTFLMIQSKLEDIRPSLENEKRKIAPMFHQLIDKFSAKATAYIALITDYAKITNHRDTIASHLQNQPSSAKNN